MIHNVWDKHIALAKANESIQEITSEMCELIAKLDTQIHNNHINAGGFRRAAWERDWLAEMLGRTVPVEHDQRWWLQASERAWLCHMAKQDRETENTACYKEEIAQQACPECIPNNCEYWEKRWQK